MARDDSNRRRSERIDATLTLEVVGLDRARVHRRGNISESGLFIEWEGTAPPTGSVERLYFYTDAAEEPAASVLAILVRTVGSKDLWSGERIQGVAFEFFTESAEQTAALDAYIDDVVGRSVFRPSAHSDAHGGDDGEPPELLLRSHRPLERGLAVRFTVRTRDGDRYFNGEVQESRRVSARDEPPRFETTVGAAVMNAVGGDIDTAMSGLLEQMVNPELPHPSLFADDTVLEGSLSRVRLPALINLLAGESLTGTVDISDATHNGTVYVRNGDAIDAEIHSESHLSPRGAFKRLFALVDGHFRFSVRPVTRPQKLEGSGAFLLLDIAREIDEGNDAA